MQVILMDKVANLGNLGDVVKVRQGYARNYLIPRGFAKRASAENMKVFAERRAELEKVGERLKALKLTMRNAPLTQPSAYGVCIFTGRPAAEEILIARAY